MEGLYKCGYCGFFINSQCGDYMEHECFKDQLTPNRPMNLVADENNILKLVEEDIQEAIIPTRPLLSLLNSEITNKLIDESLISLVYERKALSDHRIPLAQRTQLKTKALWQEISEEIEGQFSADFLKERWRQLRDDFARAKKKTKTYIPSGSGADAILPKPTFKYFTLMKFIDDLDDSVTICNIEPTRRNSPLPSTSSGVTASTPEISPVTPSLKRKRAAASTILAEALHIQKEILRSVVQTPDTKPDGVDRFLVLLGEGLRRLPLRNKSRLQIRFLQMLEEEENNLDQTN